MLPRPLGRIVNAAGGGGGERAVNGLLRTRPFPATSAPSSTFRVAPCSPPPASIYSFVHFVAVSPTLRQVSCLASFQTRTRCDFDFLAFKNNLGVALLELVFPFLPLENLVTCSAIGPCPDGAPVPAYPFLINKFFLIPSILTPLLSVIGGVYPSRLFLSTVIISFFAFFQGFLSAPQGRTLHSVLLLAAAPLKYPIYMLN